MSHLKRMVIDEIQLTRHISQVKGIGFDIDFKVDNHVYTDIKWCRMIIRQILSNALKYSENYNVDISTELIDQHVALIIKDHGRGISKKICLEYLNVGLRQRLTEMKRHHPAWVYT